MSQAAKDHNPFAPMLRKVEQKEDNSQKITDFQGEMMRRGRPSKTDRNNGPATDDTITKISSRSHYVIPGQSLPSLLDFESQIDTTTQGKMQSQQSFVQMQVSQPHSIGPEFGNNQSSMHLPISSGNFQLVPNHPGIPESLKTTSLSSTNQMHQTYSETHLHQYSSTNVLPKMQNQHYGTPNQYFPLFNHMANTTSTRTLAINQVPIQQGGNVISTSIMRQNWNSSNLGDEINSQMPNTNKTLPSQNGAPKQQSSNISPQQSLMNSQFNVAQARAPFHLVYIQLI
jgi:hypothetical protein